jgi:hypothetical protein
VDEGTRTILNKSWEIFHLPNVGKNLRKAAHEKLNFKYTISCTLYRKNPTVQGPPLIFILITLATLKELLTD